MLPFFRSLFQRGFPTRRNGNSHKNVDEEPVAPEPDAGNPAGVEPAQELPVPTPTPMALEPKIEILLSRALRDVDPVRLGFDPAKVPDYVVLTLPLDLIRRQLASGKVEIGLNDLKSGLVPQYHAAFRTVEEDFRAVVPLSGIFPLLPSGLIESLVPDHPDSDWGGDGRSIANPAWITPFSAVEMAASPPVPGVETLSTGAQGGVSPAMVKIPPLSPLAQRRVILSRPPGRSVAVLSGDRPAALPIFASEYTRQMPGSPPDPLILEESDDELGESFSAASLMAEPPFPPNRKAFPLPSSTPDRKNGPQLEDPKAIGNGPQNGSRTGSRKEHFIPPADGNSKYPGIGLKPGGQPADEASPHSKNPLWEDLQFGGAVDAGQLTLRAVLGTDEWLTPQSVVDYCALLEGLSACVLLRGQEILKSKGMAAADAGAFAAAAGRTLESLAVVAGAMGIGDGGDFTLRTDQVVRSFFLGRGLCLAVWHDQPVFSGGTREKLLLITRELSNLSDS